MREGRGHSCLCCAAKRQMLWAAGAAGYVKAAQALCSPYARTQQFGLLLFGPKQPCCCAQPSRPRRVCCAVLCCVMHCLHLGCLPCQPCAAAVHQGTLGAAPHSTAAAAAGRAGNHLLCGDCV